MFRISDQRRRCPQWNRDAIAGFAASGWLARPMRRSSLHPIEAQTSHAARVHGESRYFSARVARKLHNANDGARSRAFADLRLDERQPRAIE
jgi:hypothetical protein